MEFKYDKYKAKYYTVNKNIWRAIYIMIPTIYALCLGGAILIHTEKPASIVLFVFASWIMLIAWVWLANIHPERKYISRMYDDAIDKYNKLQSSYQQELANLMSPVMLQEEFNEALQSGMKAGILEVKMDKLLAYCEKSRKTLIGTRTPILDEVINFIDG